MRVGVDIPYLVSSHDVRRYVQAMEDLGFDHVGFSEHVCCTVDSKFPAPFFTFDEPWRESVTMSTFVVPLPEKRATRTHAPGRLSGCASTRRG